MCVHKPSFVGGYYSVVYMDVCNNSILMISENGSSYSVASLPVVASSQLSDLSLCLLLWSDSGQPFLCGPQSSGIC